MRKYRLQAVAMHGAREPVRSSLTVQRLGRSVTTVPDAECYGGLVCAASFVYAASLHV